MIRKLKVGPILLSLIAMSGCAAKEIVVEKEVCRLPTARLEPTPVPPREALTNGELDSEGEAVREALASCNADKSLIKKLLNRRKPNV